MLRAVARATPHGHPTDHLLNLVRKGVVQGMRINTIVSLNGHTLEHRGEWGLVTELLLCWNAARRLLPFEQEELPHRIESINRLHERHGKRRG